MDFFNTVLARGSYRNEFTADSIPQCDIEKILLAGISAPSGYNHQTTSFLVVTDEKLRNSIAEMIPTPATKTAPLFIFPISEYWEAENGLSFEIEDYAASAENILLAVTALGYAAVWMDGKVKLDHNAEKLASLLGVPLDKHIRAVIPVGRPMYDVVQKEKKPLSARVYYNKYSEK